MTPARFRWGLIMIQIGVLLLLRNAGVFNDNFWMELVVFFPVVLIAVGIEKIFTRTRFQLISYLTTVALFLTGFYLAARSSSSGWEGNFFTETTYIEDANPAVKKLKAVLEMDRTDLTIRDTGDDMVYAEFETFTPKPNIKYFVENDTAHLTLSASRSGSLLGGAIRIDSDEPQDWLVRFCDETPLDLECYGEDADIQLNLSTALLDNLAVDADNSTLYLRLGELRPLVKVTVAGDDSKLKLRLPSNIGVSILGKEHGSYLQRLGFIETDSGRYVSGGYDTLSTKVSVEIDDRLSSLSIDFF